MISPARSYVLLRSRPTPNAVARIPSRIAPFFRLLVISPGLPLFRNPPSPAFRVLCPQNAERSPCAPDDQASTEASTSDDEQLSSYKYPPSSEHEDL